MTSAPYFVRLFGSGALALMVGLAAVQAKAASDESRRLELARKMMTSAGSGQAQDQVIIAMGDQITRVLVSRSPEKADDIRKIMKEILGEMAARKSEMNDKIAAIYAREFTLAEMEKIIAFKKSPVGQKLDNKLPGIMKESMAIGQVWGRSLAMDVMKRFQEKAKEQGLDL